MTLIRPLIQPLIKSLVQPLVGYHSSNTPEWAPPATPLLWFDPSHSASLFSDNGVTPAVDDGLLYRVNNRGSSGIHLLSATEAQRPVWDETGGLYSFLFDNSDDRLISNANLDLSAVGALTVIFARKRTLDDAVRVVCNHNGTTAPYFQFRSPGGATTNDIALTRRNGTDAVTQHTITGNGATNTAIYTWEINITASTVGPLVAHRSRYRRNRGSWVDLAMTGTSPVVFANALFSIGSSTAGASPLAGNVYQLFLLDGVPSDDDVAIYEDRCAELSGVTL